MGLRQIDGGSESSRRSLAAVDLDQNVFDCHRKVPLLAFAEGCCDSM
jgi:hypothetical protein